MEWKGWLEIEFLASCHAAVGGQLGPLKHLLHFLTSQSSESKNSTKHTKLCMDKQSQTDSQTDGQRDSYRHMRKIDDDDTPLFLPSSVRQQKSKLHSCNKSNAKLNAKNNQQTNRNGRETNKWSERQAKRQNEQTDKQSDRRRDKLLDWRTAANVDSRRMQQANLQQQREQSKQKLNSEWESIARQSQYPRNVVQKSKPRALHNQIA